MIVLHIDTGETTNWHIPFEDEALAGAALALIAKGLDEGCRAVCIKLNEREAILIPLDKLKMAVICVPGPDSPNFEADKAYAVAKAKTDLAMDRREAIGGKVGF